MIIYEFHTKEMFEYQETDSDLHQEMAEAVT